MLEVLAAANPIFTQATGEALADPMECTLLEFPLKKEGSGIKYDLVVVPAVAFEALQNVMAQRQDVVAFLTEQHNQGAEVASVCLGTFLLAETGLLHGRRATTHWLGTNEFRNRYPDVILEDGKVVVDQGRLYSCGGAFSFTSLAVYLLGKFYGQDVALTVADVLMINVHDLPQSAFAHAGRLLQHEEDAVLMAQRHLNTHFAEPLNIANLSQMTGLPETALISRFKTATGIAPRHYLDLVRMDETKKLLHVSSTEIPHMAKKIGFGDLNAFKRMFKRLVGISPKIYQSRQARLVTQQQVAGL
jgi:transcriptional regulator GlxA family with amidase domain